MEKNMYAVLSRVIMKQGKKCILLAVISITLAMILGINASVKDYFDFDMVHALSAIIKGSYDI